MVASLPKLANVDKARARQNDPCRRQKTPAVPIPCRCADDLLHRLMDSIGTKFLDGGEWQARKQGVQGRRWWRKVLMPMYRTPSDIFAV